MGGSQNMSGWTISVGRRRCCCLNVLARLVAQSADETESRRDHGAMLFQPCSPVNGAGVNGSSFSRRLDPAGVLLLPTSVELAGRGSSSSINLPFDVLCCCLGGPA